MRVRVRCRAAGGARLGQLHAVDDALGEAQRADGPDGRRHLGGAHVLSLVAEGVAHPVDEVDEALVVRAHEVARAEPAVASLEHVAHQLAPRRRRVRVPGEVARGVALVDEAEQLPRLAAAAEERQAVRATRDLAAGGGGVGEAHEAHGVDGGEQRRDEADRALLALGVGEVGVALGRRVQLGDALDAEARLEPRLSKAGLARVSGRSISSLLGWGSSPVRHTHTSGRSPLPRARRTRCARSCGEGGVARR